MHRPIRKCLLAQNHNLNSIVYRVQESLSASASAALQAAMYSWRIRTCNTVDAAVAKRHKHAQIRKADLYSTQQFQLGLVSSRLLSSTVHELQALCHLLHLQAPKQNQNSII